jgi:hypothetical protein
VTYGLFLLSSDKQCWYLLFMVFVFCHQFGFRSSFSLKSFRLGHTNICCLRGLIPKNK